METNGMRDRCGSKRASVTLMALCLTTVLSIALSGYLTLCLRSYQLSTRSFHEDQSKNLAQLGLEEALWALNQNNWTSSGPASAASWTMSGTTQSIALSYSPMSQGASGQLLLTVANYSSAGPVWPTITSSATITLKDGKTITKTLQATTQPAPLFGNAIASVNSFVSFVTSGTVDSWNSDPDNNPATPAVPYTFAAGNPVNYAAVIAGKADGTPPPAASNGVILNQAQVNGYTATFGNSVLISASGMPPGRIKGPTTSPLLNVDPTRLGSSAFIPASGVFTVTRPATSGPYFGGLLGGLLNLLLKLLTDPSTMDVYEVNGSLSVDGGAIPLLPLLNPNMTIDRPIQLIVDGDLSIGQLLLTKGKIIITPTGSLQIFVAGDGTIGGNGIDNQTKDPSKLAIFFTNSSTTNSVKYTTNADFCGVIYSVNKPIDIQQNATFYGALLSGQSIRFTGSATAPVFHYDTALRNRRFKNVTTPYMIKLLTEP
jgi:hypothetical protein